MSRTSSLFVVLGICGCQSSAAPVADLTGVYVIEAVNGSPLPAVMVDDVGGWRVTILSGAMTITNGHYSTDTTVRREVGGAVTVVDEKDEGRVILNGKQIALASDHHGSITNVTIVDARTLVAVGDLVSVSIRYRRH